MIARSSSVMSRANDGRGAFSLKTKVVMPTKCRDDVSKGVVVGVSKVADEVWPRQQTAGQGRRRLKEELKKRGGRRLLARENGVMDRKEGWT